MEILGLDVSKQIDCHETPAATFVEGRMIQDACDDACCICLENFTESDPLAVTSCNHQYHLQCILEWCQRSSNCPMCWRQVSLKEPTSQKLLEAVEKEKKMRANASRNAMLLHRSTLREFQFPSNASDAEIEERILQHLASAMGSRYQYPRREGRSGSSSLTGRSRFIVFSPATVPPGHAASSSLLHERYETESPPISRLRASRQFLNNTDNISDNRGRNLYGQSSVGGHETANPSELQAFSESLRSRFSSLSMRYRESILRSTRSLKERLFAHTNSISDLRSETPREVNAGRPSVSRMMVFANSRSESGSTQPFTTSNADVSLNMEGRNRN